MNKQKFAHAFIAVALVYSVQANAQSEISGQIKSNEGEHVSFATIGIKNTQLATISDAEGNFNFKNLKNDTYVINVHSLGYLDKSDTVTINGNATFDVTLTKSNKQLDEVVVNSTRVDKGSGMAYNNVDAETLKKQNLGQDAPYMLNQLPSVVVNSDAGNGVGYTGMRIRGSDGTRINVTINGVPVNDAESQGTFFVDMPDLVSSVNNIQVQRGVGASSNGAGAFGASVNFQTNQLNEKPYANMISTAGSYNTLRNTLAAGTGLLNGKFTLDARASRITSDGYIDRANSNLQSYYLAAGYYGKKTVIKLINFLGQEKTYQAWNYVDADSIKNGNRTFNSCGLYFDKSTGKVRYYDNETDNYKQNNFQLHIIHQFNSHLSLNVTGHYTKGLGYYEQYKDPSQDSALSSSNSYFYKYGLNDVVIGGDTISQTALIRRLWLNNDFAGGIFNLNYKPSSKLDFTLGGGYNTYFGQHYNRLMWAQYASTSTIDYQYSSYNTNKNDGNIYLKTNYKPMSRMNVFVDLQMRNVAYRYVQNLGEENQSVQTQAYSFFNPKAGVSYDANSHLNVYASVAVGHKEPSGDDLAKNPEMFRPVSEEMIDIESGVKYVSKIFYAAINFYNMQYNNQLVQNGQIDNVGNAKHVNVANSYRRGIEIEANVNINRYFSIGGNVALSQNKIVDFKEYIDSTYASDTYYHVNNYKNTDIAFSPNVVSALYFTIKPIKNLEISFINKYVSRQYLDNTSNKNRSINPYNVLNARVNYTIKTKLIPEIGLMLSINNMLSQKYETNGYTYSYYYSGDLYTSNNLAPAAPINFMCGVNLKF